MIPIVFPVLAAAALHLIEGLAVVATPSANGSLGMAALLAVWPDPRVLGAVLLGATFFALGGLAVRHLAPLTRLCLMAPQQALLVITAGGALRAVWVGAYADAVLRSHLFILVDQYPRIVFAALHVAAVMMWASRCRGCPLLALGR